MGSSKARTPVRPRLRLGGLVKDWTPDFSAATALEVAALTIGKASALPLESFAIGDAAELPVEAFAIDEPCRAPVPEWALAQAASHTIGWFDFDLFLDILHAKEATDPADTVPSTPPSLSPLEDLARRLAAALQPPLTALTAPHGVLDWPAPLLPYQREGITALLARRDLLLADDMGLGKTIQAIAALRILSYQQRIASALVVCPASLLTQWQRELARWAADLTVATVAGTPSERGGLWRVPAHVKLVSYETLRQDVLERNDSPVLRQSWDLVVLDEASRIKNREAGITLACKRLPRKRRWALTGTPLENSTEDVVSILEFLVGEPDRRTALTAGGQSLKAQLQERQLRRKKEDVLPDLPPKQVIERVIDLPPAQRAAYDQAEQEGVLKLVEYGASVTITHVLELIVRLKQLCNGEPVSGESAKLADIAQRLGTLVEAGYRALVFSQFTDDMFGVGRAAAYLNAFQPLQYTGSLSAGQKAEVVARFLAEPRYKVLLLSLRAGGVGLNLQAASYVFHLDRWWNPAIEEQADSRAHRMGQPYPVTVYRYVCANTIEERIDRRLKEKRQLFQEIVDDVSLSLETALDESELFGLFGLAAPTRRAPRRMETHFETMSGLEFEAWVAERLRRLGFQVERTPGSRDGGIDLIASRLDALQIETRLILQCKNFRQPVGVAVIRELRGVVPDRAIGTTPTIVCPSGFTAEAVAFAAENGIRLWGQDELRQLAEQETPGPMENKMA